MKPQNVLTVIGVDLGKEALTLRYFDIKNDLGDTFYRKYFKDWSTDNTQVRMWDKEKKIAAIMSFNQLVFSSEENDNPDEMFAIAKEMTAAYYTALDAKKALRIGMRTVTVFPVKQEYDALVGQLQSNFYPASERLHQIATKEFADVAFVVDFKKFGFYNHVQLGPVRDEEIKQRMAGMSHFLKEAKLPEVSLMVDVDVSRKDFEFNGVDHFWSEARKTSQQLTTDFGDFSFAK